MCLPGETLTDFVTKPLALVSFLSRRARMMHFRRMPVEGFLRLVCVSCILLSPNPLRLGGEGYFRYLERSSGLDAQRRLPGLFLQHPQEQSCTLVS